MTLSDSVLATLERRFQDRPAVGVGEALVVVPGRTPANPHNAAQQAIQRGTYPFPWHVVGGRRCVLLVDIARVLAGETGAEAPARTTPRRRPGRPRKATCVAAAREGQQ